MVDALVSSLTGGFQRLMSGILPSSRGESAMNSRRASFKRNSSAHSQKDV